LNEKREAPTKYHELVLYSLTRWIGSFFELKSFNENKDVFQLLMVGKWKSRLILPTSFFSITEELEYILKCLKKPFDLLQSSDVPIVSWQLILMKKVFKKINDLPTVTSIASDFKKILIDSFQERILLLLSPSIPGDEFEFKEYMRYKFCELLDPTTRDHWGNICNRMKEFVIEFSKDLEQRFQLDLMKLVQNKKRIVGMSITLY
jgi:hypothetical protein